MFFQGRALWMVSASLRRKRSFNEIIDLSMSTRARKGKALNVAMKVLEGVGIRSTDIVQCEGRILTVRRMATDLERSRVYEPYLNPPAP